MDHEQNQCNPNNGTFRVIVTQVALEAEGVISLRLVSDDGELLPQWTPGAHIDLRLPSGRVRQFSLCGSIHDRDSYRIAVLRERQSRGGSIEIHDTGLVGRVLEAGGPRNHFEMYDAQNYLFIAGGIGITPLIPMIEAANRRGAQWRLAYGGRTKTAMAFLDELTTQGGSNLEIFPEDERGLLPLKDLLHASRPDALIYGCGPPGMLQALEATCRGRDRHRDLHIERFSPPNPLPSDDIDSASPSAFEVELRRTGTTLQVQRDESLLEVLLRAVPDLMYSCEEGYCGACEVKLLEGVPEHHDLILTEAERAANNTMMVCVGRAKTGRLVLDL